MAKPALARAQASQLLRSAASAVLNKGGVLTDIKSYGERELAYEIRRPGMKLNEVRLVVFDKMPQGACMRGLHCPILLESFSCLFSPLPSVARRPPHTRICIKTYVWHVVAA